MKRLALFLWLLAGPAFSGEIIFSDKTPFNNFTVRQINPDDTRTNAFFAGADQFFATEGWKNLELRKFVLDFTIPTTDEFKIEDAKPFSLSLDVLATDSMIESGFNIPVHFITCKASCGFKDLEGFSRQKPEEIFASYFMAAQLAIYYRVTYPDQKSAQGKRAVRIWRDAAYSLCLLGEGWFLFPQELIDASEHFFETGSKAHTATISYAQRILQGKCKQ
ncbi:MAG: hypothetical protein AAF393_15665 [Pseudomonadota bacterium]